MLQSSFCSVQTRYPNTEWHASPCVVSMKGIAWDKRLPRMTLSGPMSHSRGGTHLVYQPRKRQISCMQRVFSLVSCATAENGVWRTACRSEVATWRLPSTLALFCRRLFQLLILFFSFGALLTSPSCLETMSLFLHHLHNCVHSKHWSLFGRWKARL